MVTHLKPKLVAVLAAALFVAACGSSGFADGIASFGNAFVAMFGENRNATPVDAQSIPITVSFTTDPFNP